MSTSRKKKRKSRMLLLACSCLVCRLWKSSVGMRLPWLSPTNTKKRKNMTRSKKEELLRGDVNMDSLQTQGNKFEAHCEKKGNSESIAKLRDGGKVLFVSLFHHWRLSCFVFVFFGWSGFVWCFCIFLVSGSPPFRCIGMHKSTIFPQLLPLSQ